MSASDHLQPAQFMSVERIGKMKSVNRPEGTVEDWDKIYRAGEAVQHRARFEADIAAHGVQEPLEVGIGHDANYRDVLYEGHHRWSAAKAAGQPQVPVEVEESWDRKPRKR